MTTVAPLRPRILPGLRNWFLRAFPPPPIWRDASAEAYARDLLARKGSMSERELTAAVCAWLARRERSIGGGVADLGLLGDALWQDEAAGIAARVLAAWRRTDE